MSDGVATTQALSDLENQAAGFPPASPLPITGGRNYEYDGSGNLVYDRSEGTLIKWNAQGKVAEVRKDQFGVSQTTKFWYNAAGNRVKKQVINHLAADPEESSVTYYVRDANEAVMAIYQQTVFHASGTPGCLRKPNNGGMDMDMDGVVDAGCDKCTNGVPPTGGSSWNPWQEDYDKDGMGDACDPCPFIFGSACDPQQPGLPAMPEQWTGVATTTKLAELPIYGSERLGLMRPNVLRDTVIVINPTPSIFTRRVDQKEYELKDHLGNVRVVVSDMKKRVGDLTATFTLRVKSVNNYYAFGMLEEGMSGSSEGYRYGYNGKEMDNELKGVGNSVDYGARMYDPRLGRWGSLDPLSMKYPGLSTYSYVNNNGITNIDPNGKEIIVTTKEGKELFRLDDKKKESIRKTAKEIYDMGIQWFEPEADNYMQLTSQVSDLSQKTEIKHFTWDEIAEFAEINRAMLSYRQGGSGDWKSMEEGADGYLLVTVGGQPYWSDAIGQIAFAVDYYTDKLIDHGTPHQAILETVEKAREFGDGSLLGILGLNTPDHTNGYDIYMILRGATWASIRYSITGNSDSYHGMDFFEIRRNDNFLAANLRVNISNTIAKLYGLKK